MSYFQLAEEDGLVGEGPKVCCLKEALVCLNLDTLSQCQERSPTISCPHTLLDIRLPKLKGSKIIKKNDVELKSIFKEKVEKQEEIEDTDNTEIGRAHV